MLCEKILGNLKEDKFKNIPVDYVNIQWYDTYKKLHKTITDSGEEIGIRLDNNVLKNGINQGDVLYCDEKRVVAVNIPPCDVIVVKAESPVLVPKICYEIGNRHATLFSGDNDLEFITPYNEPMFEMLNKIHRHIDGKCVRAVAEKRFLQLNFDNAISSTVNNHTH